MVDIEHPKKKAAGVPAVLSSFKFGFREMGPARTGKVFLKMNQDGGFDCPSCAWPDPDHKRKHAAEFCENGAKAVAWEATRKRVPRSFFAQHSIEAMNEISEFELGKLGRITEPMLLRAGATNYEPVGWDEAFQVVARHLKALVDPNDAVFYPSGRTSNEAAFLYQLFVRAYGTNNLPDCSNMCHESSGAALTETIGIGKGTVSLEDIGKADLILVVGQNPGTNHPRMLTALADAKRNGTSIVTINPLREAGMVRFKDPQRVDGVLGKGTVLSDQYLQIRINGDLALFQALGRRLLEAEDRAPGTVVDRLFIDHKTSGCAAWAAPGRPLDDATVTTATGLSADEIDELAQRLIASRRTIVCWA